MLKLNVRQVTQLLLVPHYSSCDIVLDAHLWLTQVISMQCVGDALCRCPFIKQHHPRPIHHLYYLHYYPLATGAGIPRQSLGLNHMHTEIQRLRCCGFCAKSFFIPLQYQFSKIWDDKEFIESKCFIFHTHCNVKGVEQELENNRAATACGLV